MRLIIASIFLLLVGCSSARPKSSEVSTLHVITMDGKSVALRDELGDLTFVTFWASWCKSCKLELDALNYLGSLHYHQGVKVIGVSIDENQVAARAASGQSSLNYVTLFLDDQKTLQRTFSVSNVPVTVVLDREGNLISFPDPETGVERDSIPGLKPWGNALSSRAVREALG